MCTIRSHRGMVKGQERVKGYEFIKLLSSTTRTKYRYDFNRVLTWDLWTQSSPSQPFYQAQFRELFNRKLLGLNPAPCPAAARAPASRRVLPRNYAKNIRIMKLVLINLTSIQRGRVTGPGAAVIRALGKSPILF